MSDTERITNLVEKYSELGNGKRLVFAYGDEIRYCAQLGGWLTWDGRRWCRDEVGGVMHRAKLTIRHLDAEVPRLENEQLKAPLRTHINRSERAASLRAMVELAQSEPSLAVRSDQLDTDPWLLNCANGTVELRTGVLQRHRQRDLITKLAPVAYDPNAQSDVFDNFLRSVTSGNEELVRFLQIAAGYTAIGINMEEKAFILRGGTASGKSTFVEAVKATLGDYARTTDFETLLRRNHSDGPRNDLARLKGARMVSAGEVTPGRQLDEATIKALTGGDTITARFLHQEHFEFVPQFTLWLHVNHLPAVRDDDPAIWRRIVAVPFDNTIPAEDRDPSVKARLRDPKDGGRAVLRWIVEGALLYQREGLRIPDTVRKASEAYRSEMATFGAFIEDRCVEGPEQWSATSNLTAAYHTWSNEQGYRFPYGAARIKEVLRGRGHSPQKRGGVRGWQGIGLVGPTIRPAVKPAA